MLETGGPALNPALTPKRGPRHALGHAPHLMPAVIILLIGAPPPARREPPAKEPAAKHRRQKAERPPQDTRRAPKGKGAATRTPRRADSCWIARALGCSISATRQRAALCPSSRHTARGAVKTTCGETPRTCPQPGAIVQTFPGARTAPCMTGMHTAKTRHGHRKLQRISVDLAQRTVVGACCL